ncbi:MAG: protein phosphatase 2C domain-containing protein [Tannerellaceae bacterium]|jgi:serine/threonine protein phosphatase PrpC|nr:protein phosphatase 2C domain-containing protein [Tannerellaceae bacterium]
MNEYTINILSRIGGREENQDAYGCCETEHGLLVVVCDGMGGAKGGSTASNLAVETIMEGVSSASPSDAGEILLEAITMANSVVYQTGCDNPELQGMGTTVVALLISEDSAVAAHVGDSRIYQVRGSKKIFRTFDHSMVFELVRRGRISEEQARLSAESNVILRALGTKPEVDVEINRGIHYLKGDRFLLCSDGVWGAAQEKDILQLVAYDKSVDKTVENIMETIDNIGIEKGGRHDNLTAGLIETGINSKIQADMNKKSKIIIGVLSILLLISICLNIWGFIFH